MKLNLEIIELRVASSFLAKVRPTDLFAAYFFDLRKKAKELKEQWSQEARTKLENILISDLNGRGAPVLEHKLSLGKYKGSRFMTSAKLKVQVKDKAEADKLLTYLVGKYSPKYKLKTYTEAKAAEDTEDGVAVPATADYNIR